MSAVLKFRRDCRKSEPSLSRLTSSHILTNVAALVAQVEALRIERTEDLRQAIFLLDLASTSVRLIIRQINIDETARTALMFNQTGSISSLALLARRHRIYLKRND